MSNQVLIELSVIKEAKNLAKLHDIPDTTKVVVFYEDGESLSVEVFSEFKRFSNLFMVKVNKSNPFNFGFNVGRVYDPDSSVSMIMEPVHEAVVRTALFGEEKKTRAPRKKSETSKNEVITEPAKKEPVKREKVSVKTLADNSAFDKEPNAQNKEIITQSKEAEDKKKARSKIVTLLKSSSNPSLAKIAKDENLTKRLIKAVKDSSDPKIGLRQLLNVYMGKDVTEFIITDVVKIYKEIKES
ncbi:MAG: hypothetical protein IK121_02470 [Lachnospiraceae bacterium]|nr:hypothetical protein [Lachnospiraceae bacterium]